MWIPKSVLIVDDETHVRTFLRMLLKQMGATLFLEASNGKDGVSLYDQHRPDLVLLDINMPVKNGLDALDEILALDEDAVCVMMTAEATRDAVERAGDLGACQFIRKDTSKDTIQGILRELFTELSEDEDDAEA